MSRLRRPYRIHEPSLRRTLTRRAYHRQGGLCYFCQQPFPLEEITADHFVPRYAGGITRGGNIVASCATCNNTRNSETNRMGKDFRCVAGDDTPRSPFEVLKK